MKNMKKKAECIPSDGGTFPVESCRERLARKWGEHAVALSGPCEGKQLCDCVCDQLQARWDKIKNRFSGDHGKVVKLATKIAESYMRKDDTKDCVKVLEGMGFSKNASTGIASYLKAYAIEDVADAEIETKTEEVAELDDLGEPESDLPETPLEDLEHEIEETPAEEVIEDATELDEAVEPMDDMKSEPVDMASDMDPDIAGGEVTITIPADVLTELHNAIKDVVGEPEGVELGMEEKPLGGPMDSIEEIVDDAKDIIEGPSAEIEVITEEPFQSENTDVPGETVNGPDETKQFVTTEEEKACGKMSGDGKPCEEKKEDKKAAPKKAMDGAETEEVEEAKCSKCGKPTDKEASSAKTIKTAEEMRKLGPEMAINNTDQLAGGKPLGTAKEKTVEAPKPISEGNLQTDGYSAGDKKFQDGKTMGKEEKFDAKEINKSDVMKGGTMGNEEKFDAKAPVVPSLETALPTKGTVIATVRADGVLIETAEGKKYLAKHPVKASTELGQAISDIPFDGDGKKFAKAVLKLLKAKELSKPEPISKGNLQTDGYSAGDKKFQDGKTIGKEKNFDAKEVNKSDVMKGGTMGKEEKFDAKGPDVPVAPNKGKLGQEELEGGCECTKGTVIAENQEQNRKVEDVPSVGETKVREARLKAASIVVSSMLANGEISEAEYSSKLEEMAALPIPAIQALANSIKVQRERMKIASMQPGKQVKVAGLHVPVVVQNAADEISLKEKLVKAMKMTRDLDRLDNMEDNKR